MDTEKLAAAVLEMKTKVRTIMDSDVPEIEAVRDDLRDVKDLLGVLANIVGGKSVARAFGSPGDWGYDTPIGAALAIQDTAPQPRNCPDGCPGNIEETYHPNLDGPAEPVGLSMPEDDKCACDPAYGVKCAHHDDEARGGALKPSEAEEIKSNILKSQDKVDGAITLEKVKEWISQFKLNLSPKTLKTVTWLIQEVERLEKELEIERKEVIVTGTIQRTRDELLTERARAYDLGKEETVERCMQIAQSEKVGEGDESDKTYNQAIEDVILAIAEEFKITPPSISDNPEKVK